MRRLDLTSGEVIRESRLEAEYFAEGLAFVEGRLVLLTWREGTAIVFDASTMNEVGRFSYDGEGWGLCFDGTDLVMSDGSSDLVFRDPTDFRERRRLTVSESGQPVDDLNELECVGNRIFANEWKTDRILEIDPVDGVVTAIVDAAGLLSDDERRHADVLNGIAYNPDRNTFLVTGKDWPWMFEVVFR